MEEDVIVDVELDLLNSNIKRKVCNVMIFFLYFLKKFDERKDHNMCTLVLDSKFRNIKIIFTFIVKELKVVVEDYDKKALFTMLLKTHHFLHYLAILNLWKRKQVKKILTLTLFRWP